MSLQDTPSSKIVSPFTGAVQKIIPPDKGKFRSLSTGLIIWSRTVSSFSLSLSPFLSLCLSLHAHRYFVDRLEFKHVTTIARSSAPFYSSHRVNRYRARPKKSIRGFLETERLVLGNSTRVTIASLGTIRVISLSRKLSFRRREFFSFPAFKEARK